jgi:hypothetical protein
LQAQQQPVRRHALQVQQQVPQVQQQQVPQVQQQQVSRVQQQPDLREQVITIIQSPEVTTIIRNLINSIMEERSDHDSTTATLGQQVVPALEDQQRQTYREQLRKVEFSHIIALYLLIKA